MTEVINEAIIYLINDGLLSMRRINNLIYIKDLIDRISTTKYLEDKDIINLENKYGVKPSIITWGDYFQTEMATNLIDLSDADFDKAVGTVRFDMMASFMIFSEQDHSFFDWINANYTEITSDKASDYSEEEEEILHLKILMDYYFDLGLVNNFTDDEMKWYSSFEKEAMVI